MLVDKMVKIKINGKNIEYYKNKGYKNIKLHEEIDVKTEDLIPGTHMKVRVKCDYCEHPEITAISYQNYYNRVIQHITGKYTCFSCKSKKTEEGKRILFEQGKLKEGDSYYYNIKENRMKALKKCIETHGTIISIYETKLHDHFHNHNHNIREAVEELGYDYLKLRNIKPNNYWDDFKKIEELIQDFISVYKRFPTLEEINYEIGITGRIIQKHGGISEVKRKMNYKNNEELVDSKGDYNRSSYELITANFLFAQNISYKREQKPFSKKERPFRSDFTFFPLNEKPIHVEIWGYPKDNISERGMYYNEKRKEKEKLYQKYGITLISIEPDTFQQSYEKIEKSLNDIFSKHFSLTFKKVDQALLIPAQKMSDEEILKVVMKFVNKENYIIPMDLGKNNLQGVYDEIIKRHRNFREFADKNGLKMYSNSPNYWNHERIRERLVYMIKTYHQIYSEKIVRKMDDYFLKGLTDAIYVRGGWMYHRMKAYQYCLENNIELPESELKYIRSKYRSLNIPKTTPIDEIINLSLKKASC